MSEIAEMIREFHGNAVMKGFYECPSRILNNMVDDGYSNEDIKAVKDAFIAQRLMLITSELGEALEANRITVEQDNFITIPDDFEEWRDIEGYNGEYEVSNLGRVRSLDLQVWSGKNYYTKNGKILSPGLGGTGYYTVALRGKSFKVAILVAKAFCEGYEEGLIVNHINGIKTDDYANNLEWVTYGDNNKHAIDSGLRDMTKVLSKDEIIQIAFLCKNKMSHKEIHKLYPQVSLSRIKGISRIKEKYTDTFEFELADAVIRIFDLAGWLEIDLGKHIQLKHRYNITRPMMHGGKSY